MIVLLFCPQCGTVYGCIDTDFKQEFLCFECPFQSFLDEFGGICQYQVQALYDAKLICPMCVGVNHGTL